MKPIQWDGRPQSVAEQSLLNRRKRLLCSGRRTKVKCSTCLQCERDDSEKRSSFTSVRRLTCVPIGERWNFDIKIRYTMNRFLCCRVRLKSMNAISLMQSRPLSV